MRGLETPPEKAGLPTDPEIAARGDDTGKPTDNQSSNKGKHSQGKAYSPDSTLDEQVRLFDKAKARLASREYLLALEHLNRLKQRYPRSPLSLEAMELKAHTLAGLQRYQKASRTVQTLVRAKIPTRKKAQLYRFLGDLQVKQNLCDKAVESYRRALGLGLSATETEAAKSGIRKCLP